MSAALIILIGFDVILYAPAVSEMELSGTARVESRGYARSHPHASVSCSGRKVRISPFISRCQRLGRGEFGLQRSDEDCPCTSRTTSSSTYPPPCRS